MKNRSAVKILAIYIIIGGLWILFSDLLLESIVKDPDLQYKLQTPKGLFFVLVTGILLFVLINRDIKIARNLYDKEFLSRQKAEESNRKLTESEKRYKDLFTSNPNPMWVYDLETLQFLDVNEAATSNYGYTKEEFLSLTIKDIRPTDDIPKLMENIRSAKYGLEYSTGWKHIKKDGSIIDVEIRSNAIMYQDRKAKLVSAIDVTWRKKAEDELRASNEKLKAFFDSRLIGILFGDIHGSVFEANDEFLRIIGYSRDDLQGGIIRWDKITPEEFLPLDFERVAEAQSKGVCTPYEKKYIRKDGSLITVLVGYILVGPDRENSVAFILDLTLLKEIEKKRDELVLQREDLLKRIQLQIERMPVGYVVTDENFRISFWNPAAEKIFGFTSEEIIGKDPFGMILTESSRKYISRIRKEWLNGSMTAHSINENLTKDGRTIMCEWTNTPLLDENGNFKELLSMVTDITERIKSEEELKKSREELRALASYLQSVREKERIAISRELHDELGQILTSVKMNLVFLGRELAKHLDDPDSKYFETEISSMSELLDRSVKSVRKIISDLRPEVLVNLELVDALKWQIREFNSTPGIHCEFFCNCDEKKFDSDFTTAIFRILQEALTNVKRHSGADLVNVSLICNENQLILSVQDNGKGIPHLTKGGPKTFGLLGIRERAIILGGDLEINSSPQKGTEIKVAVPMNIKSELI